MIVCLCKGVSDKEVRKAVEEGHHCFKSVVRRCGAGTGTACGGCHETIRRLIAEYRPCPKPQTPR